MMEDPWMKSIWYVQSVTYIFIDSYLFVFSPLAYAISCHPNICHYWKNVTNFKITKQL